MVVIFYGLLSSLRVDGSHGFFLASK